MRAGSLRHIVTLQKFIETRNNYGESEQAWSEVSVLRANIKPVSGREYFAADQVNSEVTTSVVIRYRSDVSVKDRLVFKGRTLEIVSVINVGERSRWLEIKCKESADG